MIAIVFLQAIFLYLLIKKRNWSKLIFVFFLSLMYTIFFLFFIQKHDFWSYWPDSVKYYQVGQLIKNNISIHFLFPTFKLRHTLLHYGSNSWYNYFYYLFTGWVLSFDFELPLFFFFLTNLLILNNIYLGISEITDYFFYKKNEIIFFLFFFISTNILFWSLFLLKDTLVSLFVILVFVSFLRKDYLGFMIFIYFVFITRWYVTILLLISTILFFLHKLEKKKIIISLFILILLYFLIPPNFISLVKNIILRQQEWAMTANVPKNKFLSILKFLFAPVKPEYTVKYSLYSFLFWKILIVFSFIGIICVKKVRNFVIRSNYKIVFIFCVITILFYSFFPKFNNFRHRAFIEPLFLPLFLYTTQNFLNRFLNRLKYKNMKIEILTASFNYNVKN